MAIFPRTDTFTADEVCTMLGDESSDASEMVVDVRFICGSICD